MKTSIKASLIATAIAMLPFGSHAAGLGSIHVFSGIGQPLRAEIELNASAEELQSLAASVAAADAFKQASLQYSPAVASLRLAVERRGNRSVVKISSDRPFNEPFVELLLELNWASGRMVREYTFLLDPVPTAAQAPVAARPASSAAAPALAAPAPTGRPDTAAGDRYRVQRGDTLRRIAETRRPDGASLEQMLVALFRANPDAFDDGNVNRLRAGSILKVPGEAEVQSIDPVQARREMLAQSADFESYRRTLATTVASRPAAAEQAPSRGDAGSIVPKVSESAGPAAGDQVKVSGGSAPAAAAKGDQSDARLARLEALEEELAARGKALDEANSRLVALEDSIRKIQQLIELRNQGLAQAQQQATAQNVPAATPAAPVAEKPAEPAAAATPAADEPKPIPPKAPAPAVKPAPVEEPSFLRSLLDNPSMLAGGGGVLALLLAYAGLKVRQRRQQSQSASGTAAPASEFPVESNSVFGKTGGQNVNTGESSVLHTDFSQSGLSAIDTDEGVDPVAEADVYMAYGRDAQAEEILLDALKTDGARLAIYVKLLEIYAQRNSVKAFETTATDLYARTGGEGPEWGKAAEMGRRIDPDNPLYRGSAQAGRVPAGALAGAAVAAGVVAGAAAAADESPVLEFGATRREESKPAASVPMAEPVAERPSDDVEFEALPEIDANALDFDLDAGLGLGDAPGATVAAEIPELDGGELEMDLDIPGAPAAAAGEVADAADEARELGPLNETVIGEGLDFAAADQGLEFDLGAETAAPAADLEEAGEFNLDATVIGGEEGASAHVEPMDLEKTSFDSSLLDFDFNLEDAGEVAPISEVVAPPSIDLSNIDLELDSPTELNEQPEVAEPKLEEGAFASASGVSPLAGDEGIPSEVLEEVNTKLELARAYEEMGDSEGARELLEEVQREGSAEQRQAAAELLGRLG